VDRSDVGSRFMDAADPRSLPAHFDEVGKAVDRHLSSSAPKDSVAGILHEVRAALGDSIAGKDAAPPAATGDGPMPQGRCTLNSWLQDQEQRGELEHGVLGAWFMRRLCLPKGGPSPVVQSALRAIVLHEALDVRVALDRDPVAGLLVLCNEIFVWR